MLYSWLDWEEEQDPPFSTVVVLFPPSCLHCLCCSFQKTLHSYFLREGDGPCCLLAANSLFLFCHLVFIISVRRELLMIPNPVLLDLRDAVSEMSHDRFASQTKHCSFMSL